MTKASLDRPVVSIVVNDIKIIALKKRKMIEQVKLELIFAFSKIEMGSISFYLGLKMQRDQENRTIKLSQSPYIEKVLNKFYLNKVHAINISIEKDRTF